jgi:hypothetical protein
VNPASRIRRGYGKSLIYSGKIVMLDFAPRCQGQLTVNKSSPMSFWILAGVLALAPASVLRAQSGPVVWLVPEMTRVPREGAVGNRREITLWAARGEYESFQVVVHAPARGLTNVNVTTSNLTGNPGRISKVNLTLYREHYIEITRSSPDRGGTNRPLGPGWYPDALIPFTSHEGGHLKPGPLRAVPFNVPAEMNQPIWIDVFVPRDAVPGRYTGSVTITSDQGRATTSVVLNVWNFELSLRPSLLSAFNIYNQTNRDPKVFYADDIQNQELLLEHKLMPVTVDPKYERKLTQEYGLSITRVEYFQHATYGNCKEPPAPSVAQLMALKAKHLANLPLYLHLGDEISDCSNIFPVLKQWGQNARQAGLLALLTAIPLPALRDDNSGTGHSVADIWALLPRQFVSNSADVAAALEKGDRVWSYTAIVQDNFSPKWEIDFDPMNYRIYGFLNQSVGASGLLYWAVNSWAIGPTDDPWNNMTYIEHGKPTPPGEGWLTYPGEEVGSDSLVPSMRLKWIRKSVEDYEYVEILKKLHRGDWALSLVRTVAADWAHWSQDPERVEAVRRQLGTEIDRLSSAQKSANGLTFHNRH